MAVKTFAVLACLFAVGFAQRGGRGGRDRGGRGGQRGKNIVELAAGTKDLSTLVAALQEGKLVSALEARGLFTVFAPTNAAFSKLPAGQLQTLLKPENIQLLDSILEYHVVKGAAVFSKNLHPVNHVNTLQGEQLLVEKSNGHVTINKKAHVTTADVRATNGVVHIIDAVLIPPSLGAPSKNIVELAVGTADLSTLVAALKAGNLVTALEGKGPFTVFAPTNTAFNKLPAGQLQTLLKPENIKLLDSILEYHVVSGAAVYSKDLKAVNRAKTLQGQELLVEKRDGHVTVNKKAHVTTADVGATNGVVHIIDAVLIPPSSGSGDGKNIVELAVGTADLSTLVAALKAGNLVTPLEGKGPFTVFAPTNEAFSKLSAEQLKLLLDPKNIKILDAILEYHVVSGAAVFSKDLKYEQDVKTLNGQKILIDKRFGRVTINHKARVTTADVKATNGVVHIIDTVLIPSTINGKPAMQLLNPCSVDGVPINLQHEYAFEFATLDKNNNGYLNPTEFKSKGQQMAADFQKSSKNTNDSNSWLQRLRGGGRGRRLASWLDNLRKKFADQYKARQAARQAAQIFNQFDKDGSKQISLCEYENAMYQADLEAGNIDGMFNNGDGPTVVVHG